MQELEKILEEIESRMKYLEKIKEKYEDGNEKMAIWFRIDEIKRVKKTIRKHMNDGWIPVEERLPTKEECEKDNNEFLVQVDSGERFSCEYDPEANGYDNPQWCCNIPVVAWRPLPEPYRPERSEQ